MKLIETDIVIHAPAEKVWEVLTDFEKFPSWNPFIKMIAGNKVIGETLTVSIQPPGGSGMTFQPKVLVFSENREMRWKGKLLVPGLFDGEHYFTLEKTGEHSTRFVHGEKFSGLLVGIFAGMLEKTKDGFERMNLALKQACEQENGA